MNYLDVFARARPYAKDDDDPAADARPPYAYQQALADGQDWPQALIAPTGAGKTAAVVLAWFYRRRCAAEPVRRRTPRRLVLSFPMRTLVEQTAAVAETWLRRLDALHDPRRRPADDGVAVHVLMGGQPKSDWHLDPARDAILIGTQDMLLSRALNRGYGMSRYLWPWQFALLSNDCLWVFDEVQLMGTGLATGCQLAALRERFGTFGPQGATFMSATLDPRWLETVDHPQPARILTLGPADETSEALQRRRQAPKALSKAMSVMPARGLPAGLAQEVLTRHVPGTRTLVVLNTVARAVELYKALGKLKGAPIRVLLHSRFRAAERHTHIQRALAHGFDGIVVSTQVVEAGVDITSRTLFTDLAPWPALVQRAGRCNRDGALAAADVLWIDHEDPQASAPYAPEELEHARAVLKSLDSINPAAIANANVPLAAPEHQHVLRAPDLLDLFDTTADLSGLDLDISPYVRDSEEHDALVFWRQVEGGPPPQTPRARHDELCRVPLESLRDFAQRHMRRVWRWNGIERTWLPVQQLTRDIVPGMTYLLAASDGGYDTALGWDVVSQGPVAEVPAPVDLPADPGEDGFDDDEETRLDHRVTLTQHALDARDAAREIVAALPFDGLPSEAVVQAAHAHDLGKAHAVFQTSLRVADGLAPDAEPGMLWAKSGAKAPLRHARRGFRHELASALAWLQVGPEQERDLIAYLVAAHHGKVRLALRALPTERAPDNLAQNPERLYARGVWHGDRLPACDLGDGLATPVLALDLTVMRLGQTNVGAPSWTARVLALRERFGPFRLAYLEALVCAADRLASRRERGEEAP